MPNRQIQKHNRILQECTSWAEFYSGAMLKEDFFAVPDAKNSYRFSISQALQLNGFEIVGEDDAFENKLKTSIQSWLQSQTAEITCFAVHSDQDGYQILYGSCSRTNDAFSGLLSSLAEPDFILSESAAFTSAGLQGCIVNLAIKDIQSFDHLLTSFERQAFTLCFFAVPIPENESRLELSAIIERLRQLNSVKQNQHTWGRDSAYHIAYDLPAVTHAIQVLNQTQERLQQGVRYLYAYVTADDPIVYRCLINALKGINRKNALSAVPVCISLGRIAETGVHTLPCYAVMKPTFGGLWNNQFASVCTMEELTTWFLPPLQPHIGYLPRRLHQIHPANLPFALQRTQPHSNVQRMYLGVLQPHNEPLNITAEDLKKHTLIVGASASGKSTTAIRILLEAKRNDIGFVVIEASKKHYWKLVADGGISVFSPANDALPLRINPFRPEPGTLIDSHIQGVIQAFLSTFQQEDPLPQAISRLVYQCYEKCGISTIEKADDRYSYPTIEQMMELLPETLAFYDPETRSRLTAAIQMRLDGFTRGLMGRVLCGQETVSFYELLSSQTIIELEGLEDGARRFIALILAQRINESVRSRGLGDHQPLNNLLVIEEAHHVLAKSAGASADYFSNMLAELSSFGTGLIVVDQRPSILHDGVIANTGIKILHRLQEGTDIEEMARSLGLTQDEQGIARTQVTGSAIVQLPEESSHFHVSITKAELEDAKSHIWQMFAKKASLPDVEISQVVNFFAANPTFDNLCRSLAMVEVLAAVSLTSDQKIILANQFCVFSNLSVMTIRDWLYRLSL